MPRQVRTREANGREFSYLEGWYVLSEANRIFGFDGWSRETTESRCVLARESRGTSSPSTSLASASRCTQRKRALFARATARAKAAAPHLPRCTILRSKPPKPMPPNGRWRPSASRLALSSTATAKRRQAEKPSQSSSCHPRPRTGFHPDDTTPIPRPSRYYGRRRSPPVSEHLAHERRQLAPRPAAPPLAPAVPDLPPGRIDKSVLTISEPKRIRDRAHLNFVATQPCLICGRQPSDPHHLRFAQPRAIGMKVSDEFTVPLCRGHHRQLHQAGNEVAWWEDRKINALDVARGLWEQSHPKLMAPNEEITDGNQKS